jgi:hypothetical protein
MTSNGIVITPSRSHSAGSQGKMGEGGGGGTRKHVGALLVLDVPRFGESFHAYHWANAIEHHGNATVGITDPKESNFRLGLGNTRRVPVTRPSVTTSRSNSPGYPQRGALPHAGDYSTLTVRYLHDIQTGEITADQESYIDTLLEQYNMTN